MKYHHCPVTAGQVSLALGAVQIRNSPSCSPLSDPLSSSVFIQYKDGTS